MYAYRFGQFIHTTLHITTGYITAFDNYFSLTCYTLQKVLVFTKDDLAGKIKDKDMQAF